MLVYTYKFEIRHWNWAKDDRMEIHNGQRNQSYCLRVCVFTQLLHQMSIKFMFVTHIQNVFGEVSHNISFIFFFFLEKIERMSTDFK